MSWNALTWASRQECRTSSEKFTLIMLANHADENATCYPSVEALAAVTQIGVSTIRRCLSNLAIDGKIRILQRWKATGSRRASRYQLLINGEATPLPDTEDWTREYAYKPKERKPDADDPDSIPPAASSLFDQDFDTSQSERYAEDDLSKPPGARGLNLSEREVTPSKELTPSTTPQEQNPPSLRSAPPTGGKKRGTRIPDDFTVTHDMVIWARANVPDINGPRQTEQFIDYWHAASGAAAVKLDWIAAWRYWMRNAKPDRSPDGSVVRAYTNGASTNEHRPSTTDQRVAAALALAATYPDTPIGDRR